MYLLAKLNHLKSFASSDLSANMSTPTDIKFATSCSLNCWKDPAKEANLSEVQNRGCCRSFHPPLKAEGYRMTRKKLPTNTVCPTALRAFSGVSILA